MPTLTPASMCSTAFSASSIGGRVRSGAAERPVWLEVRREKALEGNPDDPAQARSQTSEPVKVVGLLVVQRGEDADAIPSRTRPRAFTCWNGGASLAGGMALGRQKQRLSGAVFRAGQQLTPRYSQRQLAASPR